MASYEYDLKDAPDDPRARELWMQHAAGMILFEDVRGYALEQMIPGLSGEAQAAAQKGIDDALYGLMMVIDGVSGGLANDHSRVTVDVSVRMRSIDDGQVLSEVNLREGDGMCIGYHGWLEGDFGEDPVAHARKLRLSDPNASVCSEGD